jgi:hypothetical protein
VTNDFYACLIQLAESYGGEFVISENGAPAYEVFVKKQTRTQPHDRA